MKSIKFVLHKDLTINNLELQQIASSNQYCIFGFTWLIYKIIKEIFKLFISINEDWAINIARKKLKVKK